ncbi:MAG: cell division transport system permease protein [Candidatus Parcubacteria bacterium]|jgi:cell division transport system permease protein|nr:cell division transport system permease protein [Candidatus Parcubacteria bacterium]
MVFTTFRRIVRSGFVNFWRNGFLSFAAIVVISLSLSAFGIIIFSGAFGRALLADVKDKVDINVYFSLNALESDILAVQKDIDNLPEVASTSYISRDAALAAFKDKWQDNALIMQGLDEVGVNPFPASLNIKAKDPGQYASIAKFLENANPTDASGTPIIEKVNYLENKLIIDRLGRIIPAIEQTGIVIAIILVIVAMIVVFNTIRLIIYTAKDEISVMKLVGASNIYVRGPLVVSGIMYGIVSALITLILMAAFAFWSDNVVLRLAGVEIAADFELMVNVLSTYFVANFTQIFLLIMGAGIALGAVSSYIAARRYLRV